MYKRKHDVIPSRFWILNQGDVKLLSLDTGEELIEESHPVAMEISSMSSKYDADENTVPENQMLIELPNYLNLMLGFQHKEESDNFFEKVFNAIRFQVSLQNADQRKIRKL